MNWRKWLSDSQVTKQYVKAGASFGDLVSYLYMGECVSFEQLLNKWDKWEQEYANRGFRPISLDRFIGLGGYNTPIDDIIGQKRNENEQLIFHAQLYKEKYLGKIVPVIDLEKMIKAGKSQVSEYTLPSTEIK